jgi:hypothetical protein
LETPTPVPKSNVAGKNFLLRIDTFLGHLKTPFKPKPGFFIHDLIFVILAALQIYNLGAGVYSVVVAILTRPDTLPHSLYVAMLAFAFIPVVIDIFLLVQVWRFLRQTQFSWIIMVSVAWSVMITFLLVVVTQLIATSSMEPKFRFNAVAYTLHQLPWLVLYGGIIFLLSRKKIRVMHKINPRNFYLAPFYGLLWVIITQALSALVAMAFYSAEN